MPVPLAYSETFVRERYANDRSSPRRRRWPAAPAPPARRRGATARFAGPNAAIARHLRRRTAAAWRPARRRPPHASRHLRSRSAASGSAPRRSPRGRRPPRYSAVLDRLDRRNAIDVSAPTNPRRRDSRNVPPCRRRLRIRSTARRFRHRKTNTGIDPRAPIRERSSRRSCRRWSNRAAAPNGGRPPRRRCNPTHKALPRNPSKTRHRMCNCSSRSSSEPRIIHVDVRDHVFLSWTGRTDSEKHWRSTVVRRRAKVFACRWPSSRIGLFGSPRTKGWTIDETKRC